MKKRLFKLMPCMIALFCVLLTSCGSNPTAETEESTIPLLTEQDTSTVEETLPSETTEAEKPKEKEAGVSCVDAVIINSESIANNNLIGDDGKRLIYVYLPESYTSDCEPMPVVYFLHGFGDSSWQFSLTAQKELDKAFDGSVKEFIMVILDGNNDTGGSFYVNSPSSGNWEDFVTKEVVDYVDSNYNTIADSSARCITGYSMGGYGALNIALNHTDIYSSLLVFCPGIYADGQMDAMWKSWTGWNEVKLSYAQAFSPNTDSEKHFGNIPEFSGTEEDNAIVAQWDSGYGCWEQKIDAYKEAGAGLKCIQINYSTMDQFNWIPEGCIFLSDLLKDRDIPYELNVIDGGHVVPNNSMSDYVIPFTEKYLAFN